MQCQVLVTVDSGKPFILPQSHIGKNKRTVLFNLRGPYKSVASWIQINTKLKVILRGARQYERKGISTQESSINY